ncbi:Ig-like domain-containing protein [Flavobacterium sp. HJ-32-4]|uniref:Ig-like domain-containing protein n=1 Tax=Flavobacterium sp. HJ-32-4 TaxID=1160795 RepID=UPI001F145BE7|nr:Ig-like domain-containing protein [Flavobacterium sp. HJ-32-4]UMY66208.1 Ig-like domain-containing protein [Flavobacterium sp. HJ-32-4]
MKNRILFVFAVLLFVLTGCARRGNIDGGPKDSLPPTLEVSLPKNFSTDFKGQEIRLTFDEYVKLKDVSKQLVVSPPLEHAPDVRPLLPSKTLTVRFRDTLRPNTTYSLNFGQSIQDNNEGVPLPQFRYVFSTGAYIDSLEISGGISDALERKADNFVTVMLYELNETFNDSTIYKEKPRYVTSTLDSAVVFKLENLKEGRYQLIALKDKSNNYKFDPRSDKIAFSSEPVVVPSDKPYKLRLFKENGSFRALRPSQASGNRMLGGFEGDPRGAVYTVRNGNEMVPSIVTRMPEKDSVQIWYKAPKVDSLQVAIKKDAFEKDFWVKLKNQKKDSIGFTAEKAGTLSFREQFQLRSATPLTAFDNTKITIRDKDSASVPFTTDYDAFNQKLTVVFEKKEEQRYKINMMPGALVDFYGHENDTLDYTVATRRLGDYGNMKVVLQNAKSFPVILELTDAKGKVLAREVATKPEIDFLSLDPATCTMRLIYDTNSNGEWDSGSWMEHRQPEEVIYFPKDIILRSNWDINQEWDVGGG